MSSNWFSRNAANFVTASRFPICFVFLWVVITHSEWISTILFLVMGACVTDWLDGFLARRLKIVSKFGGAADRLADKLLLGIVFLFLIKDGRIHLSLKIITVPLAVVETALLVYWLMGVRRRMDVSTSKSESRYGYGQIKMCLLSLAILLCLLNIIVEERWSREYHLLATISLDTVFVVCLFFAVKSFFGNRTKYLSQLPAK